MLSLLPTFIENFSYQLFVQKKPPWNYENPGVTDFLSKKKNTMELWKPRGHRRLKVNNRFLVPLVFGQNLVLDKNSNRVGDFNDLTKRIECSCYPYTMQLRLCIYEILVQHASSLSRRQIVFWITWIFDLDLYIYQSGRISIRMSVSRLICPVRVQYLAMENCLNECCHLLTYTLTQYLVP